MKNLYLTFLSASDGTRLPVDATAIQVLELIAILAKHGEPFTVTEAMSMEDIASPATIHRKINDLVKHNLVIRRHDGDNFRTKYLYPSDTALMYFHNKGRVMRDVVLKHQKRMT